MAGNSDYANALYGDPEVHQLLALGARRQALDICTPREINVSRLMAWLLDPNEGHGLGDKALRSLLAEAGRAENVANLSKADQRFLSPAKVHNLALSSLIVETELNVFSGIRQRKAAGEATKLQKRDLLDIAAIDPNMKVCVAVENKYGASESKNQLERYWKGLERLFPKYTRIHIFLDKREEAPTHPNWLAVGYGWLSEFLREQEHNPAVAAEVRRVLSEFREAVQHEDQEAATASLESRLISAVAARHQEAINAMWRVAKQEKKELFLQRLGDLSNNGSLQGQADLALFQLYHRRPDVWAQCKDQTRFAPFHEALHQEFSDLLDDVKQVKAYYSLEAWGRFIDPQYADEYTFPAAVRVHSLGTHFRVTTYMHLVNVRPDRRDDLMKIAEEFRKAEGRHKPKKGATWFDINQQVLSPKAAVDEVTNRLRSLQERLQALT